MLNLLSIVLFLFYLQKEQTFVKLFYPISQYLAIFFVKNDTKSASLVHFICIYRIKTPNKSCQILC